MNSVVLGVRQVHPKGWRFVVCFDVLLGNLNRVSIPHRAEVRRTNLNASLVELVLNVSMKS
jgi:hypothetical protein